LAVTTNAASGWRFASHTRQQHSEEMMRSIIAMTLAILALLGAFAAPAQAGKYRSVFTLGTPTCDDRYPHTCDVRGWKWELQRKSKAVRTRGHRGSVAPPSNAAAAIPAGSPALVAEARRWIGTNPTGMARLWCARFINFVLARVGHRGTGSDLAMSFRTYGRRITEPQVGAIAVLSRRGGGHVGVVSGFDARGNPIIISGNHGRRVGEGRYQRARVVAYVTPS
jgi:uncharacterized protein (TIGR02594 family)